MYPAYKYMDPYYHPHHKDHSPSPYNQYPNWETRPPQMRVDILRQPLLLVLGLITQIQLNLMIAVTITTHLGFTVIDLHTLIIHHLLKSTTMVHIRLTLNRTQLILFPRLITWLTKLNMIMTRVKAIAVGARTMFVIRETVPM